VQLTPETIGRLATKPETLRQVTETARSLSSDAYLEYLFKYCEEAQSRYGDLWAYADILTCLWAAARLLQPAMYLEIGVRRGRSMAMVSSVAPDCHLVGFDLWVPDYAGMANPGPEFVLGELQRVGHCGPVELISGDSHVTVKAYFAQHRDRFFDLITVDGDHTRRGATQDLRDVIPRLKVGGILIFDDIALPPHELVQVWKREVVARPQFKTWSFQQLGYGVGVAVRVAQ
jgi:predicted O-methyltransferase YrrM